MGPWDQGTRDQGQGPGTREAEGRLLSQNGSISDKDVLKKSIPYEGWGRAH